MLTHRYIIPPFTSLLDARRLVHYDALVPYLHSADSHYKLHSVPVSLKPSSHLPKRYNRRVSKQTRKLVGRRYERRSDFKKERIRRTLRRTQQAAKQWQKSAVKWALIAGAGVIIVVISLLLFSPLLFLREIKVRRLSPRLDIEHVQQVMSPLFNRHLLFLTASDVQTILHENINDVETIEMQKTYPSELIVTIGLHPLIARLEIVDPDEEAEQSTFTGSGTDFLTEEGVYVSTVTQHGAENLQTIRLVDWGVRPTPDTVLIPPKILVRLQETREALRVQFGHSVEMQTVYLRAQEYHMLADGISLWFDMKSSLEQHLQRYRIFLQSIPRSDIRQYIDLRLTDRIVYL